MRVVLLFLVAGLVFLSSNRTHCETGAIASGAREATAAGMEILRDGGNAIDAAVAVGLTLGVVDGYNSGIGGGCFMVVHLADGKVVTIDGRETAPAASTREMYIRDGNPVASLSREGALAIGVPGELAAFALALREYGTRPLGELLETAAGLAEAGFAIDADYATLLAENAADLGKFLPADSPFFSGKGTLPEGRILKQPDLAKTYRAIAKQGIEWFYGGPFAEAVQQWMKENDGIMTAADLAQYRAVEREPVHSTYRGYDIYSFPPPSSGGVHVIQILNMLEPFDIAGMKDHPVELIHLLAESMKRAFADRAFWLGDPAFSRVPKGLIDKKYADEWVSGISAETVKPVEHHGTPPRATTEFFEEKHTTHFSVTDSVGNWVAVTATINTSFGSKVMIPGTGVWMNNQMDDFSLQPGVPNYFGLIGGEANSIEPGKRPLSSMSPTLVLKDGDPVISLGAAGGPTIITQTVLNLVRMLDFGMTAAEALEAPRFHHQWLPNVLTVESRISVSERDSLEKLGHQINVVEKIGASQIVTKIPDGKLHAHSDPRIRGWGMSE